MPNDKRDKKQQKTKCEHLSLQIMFLINKNN